MPDESIQEFLVGLSSRRPDCAWDKFLNDYSPLILHIARRYENDDDRVMNCYVFVCEKLSDNHFRRLLKFKPEGPAKFRTWLTTVVGNLCIDWRRKQYGRQRPFRAIAKLPELEQLVFHHLYKVGLTRLECLRALPSQYSNITGQQIAEINSRIHSLLSSRQRWRLAAGIREIGSLDESVTNDRTSPQDVEPRLQIDALVQAEQDREKLEKAMINLSPNERLLLRLRYLHDLTLDEVASVMKLNDTNQAHRQIEAAAAKLAKYMDP